jgi:hypothetical protein
MADEVEFRLKDMGPCQGDPATCMNRNKCPIEGVLAKADKNGIRRVRQCKDATARGRKNRKNGLQAQRRAAKALGVPNVGPLRPGNEEHMGGLVRIEAKSGGIVRPVFTAYFKAEAQSELQRPIGDNRPFVLAARLGGNSNKGLIVLREDKLEACVYALAVQLGLIEL